MIAGWGSGPVTTGFLIALSFLFVGMFIDAIPAIIILVPMLVLLVIVILFPEFVLFLPRWITPRFL